MGREAGWEGGGAGQARNKERGRGKRDIPIKVYLVGICELGFEAKGRAGAIEEHASCAGKRHW
jgi:hypothetical protein